MKTFMVYDNFFFFFFPLATPLPLLARVGHQSTAATPPNINPHISKIIHLTQTLQ